MKHELLHEHGTFLKLNAITPQHGVAGSISIEATSGPEWCRWTFMDRRTMFALGKQFVAACTMPAFLARPTWLRDAAAMLLDALKRHPELLREVGQEYVRAMDDAAEAEWREKADAIKAESAQAREEFYNRQAV